MENQKFHRLQLQETVTIDKLEYINLLQKSVILQALEVCEVYNWSGYSDAIELVEQWTQKFVSNNL